MRDLTRQQRRPDPPAHLPRGEDGGVRAGQWTEDRLGLPREDPCPVVPLGIEGDRFHLIDSTGQFRTLTGADFSHAGIQSLFAATPHYPEWAWPRYGRAKEGEAAPIKSFEDDAVRKALFRACVRKGLFSPVNRLRGRGAWRLRSGAAIYHAGEELWLHEAGRLKLLDTGEHEGFLYPRLPPIPAPWPEKVEPKDNPAGPLLAGFRSWNWERPDVDPILLLGWLGVALIGGALRWRSAVFLIGDRETGKSTLQEMIRELLGEAVVSTGETTKAGIYQLMRHDARAVAIDELEAAADNRKQMAVVELARVASSGALGLRGGADGTGTEFQVRSAFLFSAINPPPLQAQDLSRMAILRLGPLDKARAAEKPPSVNIDVDGRMLLNRLLAEWHRWEETLAAYRAALAAGGHSGRGQDTYGTLLAAADLLLGPELADALGVPMVDDVGRWSELLAAAAVPEVEDAPPNWQACLTHLLTSRVQAWRDGKRATVGQLLADLEVGWGAPQGEGAVDLPHARSMLAQAGLGLLAPQSGPFQGFTLAIPNRSPLVAEIFNGTIWQGAAGAGGWVEALRQGVHTGIVNTDKAKNRVTVNGVQTRCTLVDLDGFRTLLAR